WMRSRYIWLPGRIHWKSYRHPRRPGRKRRLPRQRKRGRTGSAARPCIVDSILRERRERLGREHAGHALDLRHDGLKEVLAGVRADAGHDVRVSGRADDLLDLRDVLQRAHGLLRVRRPDEEVRVAGVTIFLTRRPIPECRIAPEPRDVVQDRKSVV